MTPGPTDASSVDDLKRMRTIVLNLLTSAARTDASGGSDAALRAWTSLSVYTLDKAVRQERRLKDAFEVVADGADLAIERLCESDLALAGLAQAAATVAVVEAMSHYFDTEGN
jgi:hypothetical protein